MILFLFKHVRLLFKDFHRLFIREKGITSDGILRLKGYFDDIVYFSIEILRFRLSKFIACFLLYVIEKYFFKS